MADSPTLPLLIRNPARSAPLAALARQVGFRVVPGRHHELGADALERVQPHVIVAERGHKATGSRDFRGRTRQQRLRCVLLESEAYLGYSGPLPALTACGCDYMAPASADDLRAMLTEVLRDCAA